MQTYPSTVILRHRKENRKKCSLKGLEERKDMDFFTYPNQTLPNLSGYLCLCFSAPLLTQQDEERGIFLIDGTWAYAEKMQKFCKDQGILKNCVYRSLPENLITAYPRRQQDCPEPKRGLASVEALFAAYTILQRPTQGLLDHYYWQREFLEKNGF